MLEKIWMTGAGICLVMVAVMGIANVRLSNKIAAIEAAAHAEEVRHAKNLSTATDTIVAASREYDRLRADRDALNRRLREYAGSGGKAGTGGACEARAARLAAMVRGLHELAEKCDAGWHGCAARKDALTEVIK